MKFQVVILLAAAAAAMAEPPRRSPAWGQRIMQAEAPYPPSGWKPAKPFYLPGEYGGPPAEEVPEEEVPGEEATEEAPEATTTAEPTMTAAPGDNDGAEARDNDTSSDEEPEPAPANIPSGVYYVLLPDGRLQRVNYQVAAPAGPMSGSYVLQDAGPFSSPLYVYQTPGLIQILKK